MTTKERIIEEALTLFSRQGYKGTSVKQIAEAVGIKDSSLYKHFRSKKEIFDTIIKQVSIHIMEKTVELGLPEEKDSRKAAKVYGSFDEEGVLALSKRIFLFYLTDSYISRFWKMATMEQFRDPKVYQAYREIFLNNSIAYQESLFGEMSRQGYLIAVDPTIIAMNFYTPIFFLLSKYMGQTGKEEEALSILDRQIREFWRIYHKQ